MLHVVSVVLYHVFRGVDANGECFVAAAGAVLAGAPLVLTLDSAEATRVTVELVPVEVNTRLNTGD